jgi:hypothetical protein
VVELAVYGVREGVYQIFVSAADKLLVHKFLLRLSSFEGAWAFPMATPTTGKTVLQGITPRPYSGREVYCTACPGNIGPIATSGHGLNIGHCSVFERDLKTLLLAN